MSDFGWKSIDGATTGEKCRTLGIIEGTHVDVRELDRISRSLDIAAYLYFEEDLARESDLETDLADYAAVPEFNRPFIELGGFLKFGEENDPTFTERLREFPLMVEIVACGDLTGTEGQSPSPYIKALMPFLDDVDFDEDPVGDGYLTL